MRHRVLLVATTVIVFACASIGFSVSRDGLGLVGGFAGGVLLDLVIGMAIALVLAVVRVASGSGVRAHHRGLIP